MRKTKIMKMGCMLVLSVILSSCSSKNNDKADVESTDNEIRKPIVESSIAGYEEKKLDLEKYSVRNELSTDAKTSFLWFDVTGTEYGYYFWNQEKKSILCFMIKN